MSGIEAGEQIKYKDIVQAVVKRSLNGKVLEARDLTTGYSGHVYAVKATVDDQTQDYVIKLTKIEDEKPFQEEDTDNRVYGIRLSNFQGAYDLISGAGISVPSLYASGNPDDEIPYQYHVMSLLDGISIREQLAHSSGEDMDGLHAVAGDAFGKLHKIKRAYDGWVDMTTPAHTDWQTAFFTSLDNRLQLAASNNLALRNTMDKVEKFISDKKAEWTDPQEFVLSHLDGFQGMAKFEEGQWNLTGIIDIEDHHFTDQRFVLAGYELSQRFEGRETPQAFWEAYEKQNAVDPSYASTKNLFQLYYLLSWFPMVYEENWRGKSEDRERVINRFETLLGIIN